MIGLIIALSIIGVLILLFVISLLIIHLTYRKTFFKRGDGHPSIRYPLFSEYPSLNRKPISFASKKNILHGYLYSNKNTSSYKALIVLVHGIGFGHSYLFPLINYLADNGYLIFAYDMTSSGISEGRRIKCLSTALKDIKCALNYIKNDENLGKYPLYLLGHSWGGYAVLSVLNFADYSIKKVVSISGFNSEIDFICSYSSLLKMMKPLIKFYLRLINGNDAYMTSYRGLENTTAKVLFIQGVEDNVVLPSISGELFKKVNNENVRVELLKDKGHSPFIQNHCEATQMEVMSKYGFLGNVSIPLDGGVDYRELIIPDDNVYSLIKNFLNHD